MQPTISIPQGWDYPRFVPGQWTKQGLIIGMEYNPPGTMLAHEYGQGWRYAVLPDKNSQQVFYYFDDQIQQLSVAEIQAQIQAEIEQHQQQLAALQQQLVVITGGSNGC
ncbi:hypothetical protein [Anabaena azotica]|uniref:Uncharacterized protein n=1 Tax=Anabaena azotica FACHB-119 TaxID=947527 RepID=A0ABR8DE02_9NOST|nr:hypothetical protein [Anabaena azotica]MBD2505167.1 hypothetical protein [Anabaena azotica FACHB-119]